MSPQQETIAAIATAPGRGGVGIVRISGPKSQELSQKITQQRLTPRYAHYCDFFSPGTESVLDQGLALFFKAPNSFTGEDVLELQGHGGPIVLDQLLNAITSLDGIRIARPGEFSERAFLNNKMDLAQAEAVADLINASSEQAARHAIQSLQGNFSSLINELVKQLTHVRLYIEAAIDFPEEEVDFLSDQHLFELLNSLETRFADLFQQTRQGVLLQEGMTVVIAGKPNAGKSSLLNALAGKESAIVTDIEGTTRDILKEQIHLDGMPLHIIDTAGLRESGDTVEKIGMEKAWAEIEKADHLLLMIDASETIETRDIDKLLPSISAEKSLKSIDLSRISIIFNKMDLVPDFISPLPNGDYHCLYLSTKARSGIDELSAHLKSVMGYQQANEGGFTARRRHLDAISRANDSVILSKQQLMLGAGELAAEDLRLAQQALGEITGEVTADDLLGKIFTSFCIGK